MSLNNIKYIKKPLNVLVGGIGDKHKKNIDVNKIVSESEISKTSPDEENITSKITKEGKDVDAISSLNFMKPSHTTTYEIEEGTTLYHGSKKISQFDPETINVGDNDFVAFFSPNIDIAANYIAHCNPIGEDHGDGYIHEFIVKKAIPNLYIESPHEKKLNWDQKKINANYCNNLSYNVKLNGVGFFVKAPKTFEHIGKKQTSVDGLYSSQFALCNPREFLKYVGTYKCAAPNSLESTKVNFTTGEVVEE